MPSAHSFVKNKLHFEGRPPRKRESHLYKRRLAYGKLTAKGSKVKLGRLTCSARMHSMYSQSVQPVHTFVCLPFTVCYLLTQIIHFSPPKNVFFIFTTH